MTVRSGVAGFDETIFGEALGIACISLQVAFQKKRFIDQHLHSPLLVHS